MRTPWLTVLDGASLTQAQTTFLTDFSYSRSEGGWAVATTRPAGGWWLGLLSLDRTLLLLEIAPEGAVGVRVDIPQAPVARMSESSLFIHGDALWFATAEQSYGPEKSLSLHRLDPQTGAYMGARTGPLPGGLYVHSITAHDGHLFAGGTISEDGNHPTVVSTPLPIR